MEGIRDICVCSWTLPGSEEAKADEYHDPSDPCDCFGCGDAATLAPTAWLKAAGQERFDGQHFRGRGDVEYLQLLEWGRRMFEPDAEFPSLLMMYTPGWNGFVEGPTWNMWWIQNSYGTSYCALPFLQELYVTFLENSQALWFDRMGDGKREGCPGDGRGWIPPDGQLCDAAAP